MNTQIFNSNSSARPEIQWDGRVLKFPVDMGFEGAVADRVLSADHLSADHVGAKSVNAIIRFYMLMRALSPLKEFPSADLEKILGVSNNTVTKIVKVLEETGLVVVDRREWAKGYGAGYYYRVIDIPYEDINTEDWLYYDLSGTIFKDVLDLYESGEDVRGQASVEAWDLPDWCYVSPYDELSYGFFTSDRLSEAYELTKIWQFMSKAPTYSTGRIYHAFHRSKRIFRHGFMYRGSHIEELYDLHSSFFTLTVALKKDLLPESEYDTLIHECFEGRFYANASKALYGNDDRVNKELVKEQLQAWRNCTIAQAHSWYPELSAYMENKYPVFSKMMYEWPTVVKYGTGRVKGHHVKTLQQEVGEYETRIFSKIAFTLRDKYSVTPFLLHDAVYMSEADIRKLPEDIREKINNWFITNILS